MALLATPMLFGAQDPLSWDWLPAVSYIGEPACFILRPAAAAALAGWSATDGDGTVLAQTVQEDRASLRLDLPAAHPGRISLRDGDGAPVIAVNLRAPGDGGRLILDETGRLRSDGGPAVLVVPRREAEADRRWALLRPLAASDPAPCGAVLKAGATLPWGASPLLSTIAAAQDLTLTKVGVLVLLDGRDRMVGWKHRAYRQALAWLLEDLRARGASRVVLVQGPVPDLDRQDMFPLWLQARDVGRTYDCTVIETYPLAEHRYWQDADGVIGPDLNAAGRRALRDLCRGAARPAAIATIP